MHTMSHMKTVKPPPTQSPSMSYTGDNPPPVRRINLRLSTNTSQCPIHPLQPSTAKPIETVRGSDVVKPHRGIQTRSNPKQFKAQIFERGGVSGLLTLRNHLDSMDPNGSGLLERSQLIQGLTNFGIDVDDGPGGDIEKIMGFFDRDVVGRIIIHEFHRGLRVCHLLGTCSFWGSGSCVQGHWIELKC